MSCVTFLTDAQRAALRELPEEKLTPQQVQARHPAPPVTEGKLRRLTAMAASEDPAIRQSAALNRHCPAEVLDVLVADPDESVRCCVARQETASSHILRRLARDHVATVRGWVAANPGVPADLLDHLGSDDDPQVRAVVAWARSW